MSEAQTTIAAVYMLLGMVFLVASGSLEALTTGWIDLLDRQAWLPVSRTLLYLLAVVQIIAMWAFWPFMLWYALRAEDRRTERRRLP